MMNTTQTIRSWGKLSFDESQPNPVYDDDYYYQRNIPRQQEHSEISQDFTDLCSKQVPIPHIFLSSYRAIPEHLMSKEIILQKTFSSRTLMNEASSYSKQTNVQNNDFERLYYVEVNRSKSLEDDLKCLKDILKKSGSEKDQLRNNYEEFIKKLEEEIRMLKTFEAKYNTSDVQRIRIEEELSRKITEIRLLREHLEETGSGSLLEEMKSKIRRLNEEKLALLNSMDIYRTEVNELSNRITYIQNNDFSERDNLSKMMAQIKERNARLESELQDVFERPPEDPALISELHQKTQALAILNEELGNIRNNYEKEIGSLNVELESQKRIAMKADKEIEILRNQPAQTIEKVVYTSKSCEECSKKDSTIKYLSDKLATKDTPIRTYSSINETNSIHNREVSQTHRTISPSRIIHHEQVITQQPTVYKMVNSEPCKCSGIKSLITTQCTCNCHCHRSSYITTENSTPVVSVRHAIEVNKPINTSVTTRTTTFNSPICSQTIIPAPSTNVYSPHAIQTPLSYTSTSDIKTMRTSMTSTNTPVVSNVTYRTTSEYSNLNHNRMANPIVYKNSNDYTISENEYQTSQQNQNLIYLQPGSTRARPMSAQEPPSQRFFKALSPNNIAIPPPTKNFANDSKIQDEFTKGLELIAPANDIILPSRFTLNKESQSPNDEDLVYAGTMNKDTSFDSFIQGFSFKKDSTAFGGSYLNNSMGQGNDNSSNIFKRNSVLTTETRDQNVLRGAFNEYK
jgi:hypothetical protein